MLPEPALLIACVTIGGLVALPAMQAARRRRASRESSELATALAEYSTAIRHADRCLPIDEALVARARRLAIPELATFEFAQQVARSDPALLADSALRLALRLKRRVAFERKMLARTAPGRRRGAWAAAMPAVAILGLGTTEVALPLAALGVLVVMEAFGCWLLWRVVRVEV